MPDSNLGQQFNFDQIDADAVCEQCNTVNTDGTLICKSCGNNLRDQRTRRISVEQALPSGRVPINRLRVFTGLLTTLGIVTILAVVLNMGTIEQMLIDSQLATTSGSVDTLWSGPEAQIYDDLLLEIQSDPSSQSRRQRALQDPVIETSYNGRYALWGVGDFGRNTNEGEANLSRRGDKIYFVALLNSGEEIRGFAKMSTSEDGTSNPLAMNTAGIRVDGYDYGASGYSEANPEGGHTVYAQRDGDNGTYGLLAYRMRN